MDYKMAELKDLLPHSKSLSLMNSDDSAYKVIVKELGIDYSQGYFIGKPSLNV